MKKLLLLAFLIISCNSGEQDERFNIKDSSLEYDLNLVYQHTIVLEDVFGKSLGKYISNSTVDIDNNDNIYIGDYISGDVKKYSYEGQLLNIIGKHGQGPGEFVRISSICILENDTLIIVDDLQRRISIFNPNYEFVNSFSVMNMQGISFGRVIPLADSALILPTYQESKSYVDKNLYSLYTIKGNYIRDIDTYYDIYQKFELHNVDNRFCIENNGYLYSIQQASHKVKKIDLKTDIIQIFGIRGKHYKPFNRGVKRKHDNIIMDVLELFASASMMQNIQIIKNRYLIIEYKNANIFYSSSGDTLIEFEKNVENLKYLQVYDLVNNEYLGEISSGTKLLLSTDKKGLLVFNDERNPENNILEYYSLEIKKNGY